MISHTTKKKVWTFIGLVNYYCDKWEENLPMLKPLTKLMCCNIKFKWIGVENKAFDKIQYIVAYNNVLYYQYVNRQFYIHMDDR